MSGYKAKLATLPAGEYYDCRDNDRLTHDSHADAVLEKYGVAAGDLFTLSVVDVKTGKTVPTKEVAAQHPQLAAYQLALHLGGVDGFPAGVAPGGGELVYVASPNNTTGAAVRQQQPLTPELIDQWKVILRAAAHASIGPVFTATQNDGCGHCGLVTSCPAQLTGRTVVDD